MPTYSTVTSVTPNRGKQGEHLASVVIAGSGFTGATVVDFGAGVLVNSFVVDTDIQITADISISPTALTGFRNVIVTSPSGVGGLTHGFVVTDSTGLGVFEVTKPAGAPVVTSITPATGVQGNDVTGVIIKGSGFTGALGIFVGPDIYGSFVVDSDTQITARLTVPFSAVPGLKDVSVENTFGTGTLIGGFECLAMAGLPVIISVTPNSGAQGDHIASLVIAGYFFA